MKNRTSRVAAALVLGLTVALTACASSPETSYTNEAGETITVDWRDYPASAWLGVEDVLSGPGSGEVPARSEQLLAAVRDALATEFGITRWEAEGDPEGADDWYPMRENEYGGESMLVTFNSQAWGGEASIPYAEWERVVDVVADVAARYGLDQRRNDGDHSDPGQELWLRSESLMQAGPSEWLGVSVQDANLDPSGEALEDAEKLGLLVSGVSLFYGITTVLDEDRAEFERRAAPFAGLERPKASHPS